MLRRDPSQHESPLATAGVGANNLMHIKLTGLPVCACEEPLDLEPVVDEKQPEGVLQREVQVARLLNKTVELRSAIEHLRLWEPVDIGTTHSRYDRRVRVLVDKVHAVKRPGGDTRDDVVQIECKPEGALALSLGFVEQTVLLELAKDDWRKIKKKIETDGSEPWVLLQNCVCSVDPVQGGKLLVVRRDEEHSVRPGDPPRGDVKVLHHKNRGLGAQGHGGCPGDTLPDDACTAVKAVKTAYETVTNAGGAKELSEKLHELDSALDDLLHVHVQFFCMG